VIKGSKQVSLLISGICPGGLRLFQFFYAKVHYNFPKWFRTPGNTYT